MTKSGGFSQPAAAGQFHRDARYSCTTILAFSATGPFADAPSWNSHLNDVILV